LLAKPGVCGAPGVVQTAVGGARYGYFAAGWQPVRSLQGLRLAAAAGLSSMTRIEEEGQLNAAAAAVATTPMTVPFDQAAGTHSSTPMLGEGDTWHGGQAAAVLEFIDSHTAVRHI
jgi:hypothetical protein